MRETASKDQSDQRERERERDDKRHDKREKERESTCTDIPFVVVECVVCFSEDGALQFFGSSRRDRAV